MTTTSYIALKATEEQHERTERIQTYAVMTVLENHGSITRDEIQQAVPASIVNVATSAERARIIGPRITELVTRYQVLMDGPKMRKRSICGRWAQCLVFTPRFTNYLDENIKEGDTMDDMKKLVRDYIEAIKAEPAKERPTADALAYHLMEAATILAGMGDDADAASIRAMATRFPPLREAA